MYLVLVNTSAALAADVVMAVVLCSMRRALANMYHGLSVDRLGECLRQRVVCWPWRCSRFVLVFRAVGCVEGRGMCTQPAVVIASIGLASVQMCSWDGCLLACQLRAICLHAS